MEAYMCFTWVSLSSAVGVVVHFADVSVTIGKIGYASRLYMLLSMVHCVVATGSIWIRLNHVVVMQSQSGDLSRSQSIAGSHPQVWKFQAN